jgi:hypothetical protein
MVSRVVLSMRRRKQRGLRAAIQGIENTFSTKAEECSLFGPVGRKMCDQPHELLGIELQWLLTVDDRSGDSGASQGRRSNA